MSDGTLSQVAVHKCVNFHYLHEEDDGYDVIVNTVYFASHVVDAVYRKQETV